MNLIDTCNQHYHTFDQKKQNKTFSTVLTKTNHLCKKYDTRKQEKHARNIQKQTKILLGV